ncbi:MAG: nitroreductase family protein [Bacteroidales bacterium]
MKARLSIILIVILFGSRMTAQNAGSSTTDLMLSAYSERTYTNVPVTDQQIDLILKCGIKAPSARNNQPWKFTVIKDEVSMKEIINNITPGNVLIIVSGTESQTGATPDFDCGLAAQNMFLAAHSLGLGARIYGGPVSNVNAKRNLFQLPAGYKAVVIVRIGNVDKTVDAVSAATPRKKFEEIVNFKK